MNLSRKEAFQKASIHQEKPLIPQKLQNQFPGWTHFEIRSYHKRIIFHKNIGGKKVRKKSRRVTGYIFIHLARENGHVRKVPTKRVFIEKMTRRNFAAYARSFTMNMDNVLSHVFH